MGWGRRSGAGGTQNPGPAHTRAPDAPLPLSVELRPATPPVSAPCTAPTASCASLPGAPAPAGAAAPGAHAAPWEGGPPSACAFCFSGLAPFHAASQRRAGAASTSLALLSVEAPAAAARAARACHRAGCFCPACLRAAASPAPRATQSPASASRWPLALAGSARASAALQAAPERALPGPPSDAQSHTFVGALVLCCRRRALRLQGDGGEGKQGTLRKHCHSPEHRRSPQSWRMHRHSQSTESLPRAGVCSTDCGCTPVLVAGRAVSAKAAFVRPKCRDTVLPEGS